jgi:hypothetical protein
MNKCSNCSAINNFVECPNCGMDAPPSCGVCNGSGFVVRDPDIGTDKECWACDGTGLERQ